MEKKNIDWSNLGFAYVPTDKRFVANFKNGSWDEGALTEVSNIGSGTSRTLSTLWNINSVMMI